MHTGLAEKPLQLARRNLRLMAEGEAREGHSLLQVARVTRAESGEVQLDPHYVPPLLDVSANVYLLTIARRLIEILSARSSGLAGTRRQRNRGLADFGSSDVASFWLLYTINTHLPVVRHLFETRRGHPESLFRALLGLAGALLGKESKEAQGLVKLLEGEPREDVDAALATTGDSDFEAVQERPALLVDCAAGGLDHGLAGLEHTVFFGLLDNAQRHAVLHRTHGVERLQLGVKFDALGRQLVDSYHRGVADGAENVVE